MPFDVTPRRRSEWGLFGAEGKILISGILRSMQIRMGENAEFRGERARLRIEADSCDAACRRCLSYILFELYSGFNSFSASHV